MSREPLVVSFDANSPLLTHFNVANEVRGGDLNPAVLGPAQVYKHHGGGAAPSGHHGVKKKSELQRWRFVAPLDMKCNRRGEPKRWRHKYKKIRFT